MLKLPVCMSEVVNYHKLSMLKTHLNAKTTCVYVGSSI